MNSVILLNLCIFVNAAYTYNGFELLRANLTKEKLIGDDIVEDEILLLKCRITGRTKSVDIFWQLNRTFITNEPNFILTITKPMLYYINKTIRIPHNNTTVKLYEHRSDLSIVPPYSLRNSRVRCGAMNKANGYDRVYSNDFLINLLYKPRVTLDKYYVEYKSGEQIKFTCKINGEGGNTSVWWQVLGKNDTYDGLLFRKENASKHDEGVYECYAQNQQGETVNTAYARHMPAKSNYTNVVRFTKYPSNFTLMRGTSREITCAISINKSTPDISQHIFDISMYFNYELIATNNDTKKNTSLLDTYRVSYEMNKHLTILFPNCSMEHEGWYWCTVEDLPAKRGFYTVVQRQGKPVIHVHVSKIVADKTILVSCSSAGGRPAPKFDMQLTRNGTILPNRLKRVDAKQPVEPFDLTSVTVEVTFRRNDSHTQLRCITFIEKLSNYTLDTLYNITAIYYKPIATRNASTFYEGTELRIACPVKGLPLPTIVAWYHKEKRQDKYVKDNEIVKSQASKQDSGKWTCTAENFVGVINATVTVIVVDSRYNTTIKPGAAGMEEPLTIGLIVVCLLGTLIIIFIFVARYIIQQRRRRKLLLQTDEHGSGHAINSTAGLELQKVESVTELRVEIERDSEEKIEKPDNDIISKKADPKFGRKKSVAKSSKRRKTTDDIGKSVADPVDEGKSVVKSSKRRKKTDDTGKSVADPVDEGKSVAKSSKRRKKTDDIGKSVADPVDEGKSVADPSFRRKKTDDAGKSVISSRTQKSHTHATKNKRRSKKSKNPKKFKPDENDALTEYS